MFYVIMPQYTTSYNAAMIDKYHRLERIEGSKIVLVGDSNVVYGFDSEKIQQAFNMPVVNFGLHGGLGQAFHTDMIKRHINKGDIVIIVPSSYSSESTMINDCVMAWSIIENNFDMWGGISHKDYLNMVKAYPTYIRKAIDLWVTHTGNEPIGTTSYKRESFNKYGDNIYSRPTCVMADGAYGSFFSSRTLSVAMQDYWNDYNKYVSSKEATLYISSPPILAETLDVDLSKLQKDVEQGLHFPMISQLDEYVYPLTYFFDTGFHLNETGKSVRTEQLIIDLRNLGHSQ